MIEKRFNLIDEPWIPVTEKGLVSLQTIFSDTSIKALGGNPVEKIAVFKLLLAIAQSAYTPKDEEDWKQLGVSGMEKKIVEYLSEQHDNFWLHSNKPFLQMPEIISAEKQSFGAVQIAIATGNTTVVTQIQQEKPLTDAEKAMLVLVLMGFALGGKKTDNTVVLTEGYTKKNNEKGKSTTGKPGPSLAFMGLLHSFPFSDSIRQSVWLNLFTETALQNMEFYKKGLGTAPWEKMPKGEDDETAKLLRQSYLGRLIPLSRFMMLADDGIHYSEGIQHLGYLEGIVDPSIAVDFSGKKTRVLWVDFEKKPWRQLPALLSFMKSEKPEKEFNCLQLKNVLNRVSAISHFTVWAGGVKVSSNAGEQYVSGTDDYVESEVQLSTQIYKDSSSFYSNLTIEMENMNYVASKILYSSVMRYHKYLMMDATKIAAKATNYFWQLCEGKFQQLVTACGESGDESQKMRPIFSSFVLQVYDRMCSNTTARQMEAWVKNRPFGYKNKKEEDSK